MKFKKIMSVIASAVMLSSTIGFAAAASFPEPFVSGGTADGAVIVGANAAVTDWSAAIDLQTSLQALVTTSSSTTTVAGTAWQVKTSSDDLELNESISGVESYIGSDDLPILADGTVSNEKGDAKYSQYLYFDESTSFDVNYQEDDDDNVGLFLRADGGTVIARYVMDFTTSFDSDAVTNTLEDIDDEDISILGKSYTITTATNATTGVALVLMSGANKATISNGEELTVGGRVVSVLVSSATAAQFTVDGETTSKLADGETTKLSDGTYLGVSDITYQEFAGGLMQSTFYLGADKIELTNGSAMVVNAETISDAMVTIASTGTGGDIQITEIAVNMTAEDDLYVPENGKLSAATDLDEPAVLFTQNWDIEFKGLDTADTYEEITLKSESSDKRYVLKFKNYDGNEIEFPLVFTNASGVYGGKDNDERLILVANGSVEPYISKNDYFILNTADSADSTKDARSYVLQYKGADKTGDSDPKVRFDVIGVDSSRAVSLGSLGTFDVKLGGSTFSFKNATADATVNSDFDITLTSAGDHSQGAVDAQVSNFLRTQSNALINITCQNYTQNGTSASAANKDDWYVNLIIDDTDKDGDLFTAGATQSVFNIRLRNNSDGDFSSSVTVKTGTTETSTWITDPVDSDKSTFRNIYGVYCENIDTSTAPAQITCQIPSSIVKPLVYVTSGDVTVTPGGTGAGGQILVVKDSEVSSVSGKNLVVVGGSCINSVAAKILGSDTPLCTTAWTEKTQVSAGQYIIKTVASPYAAADSGKVAMLVAGYDAADTTNAAAKAKEATTTTDVDTSQVYPITTTTA